MTGRAKGFTLIEVLVVIAIVAILAALLFPVFANAKRSAHSTNALGQLSQIGHGISLYAADHDDLIPYASGNNCFHLAVNLQRGCNGLEASVVQEIPPINAALQRFKIPWDLYRSPVDTMSRILLQEPGHRATWFEETKTARYPGSSFEYTSLGLRKTSVSGLANPAREPLMRSLYRLGEGDGGLYHVQFADGHTKAVPGAQLGGGEG